MIAEQYLKIIISYDYIYVNFTTTNTFYLTRNTIKGRSFSLQTHFVPHFYPKVSLWILFFPEDQIGSTYFMCTSSSLWATRTVITGFVSGEAVPGAIQTTAQSLGCRPHVECSSLQGLPTRRTLPQHNAFFHWVPMQASHKPTTRLGKEFIGVAEACTYVQFEPVHLSLHLFRWQKEMHRIN